MKKNKFYLILIFTICFITSFGTVGAKIGSNSNFIFPKDVHIADCNSDGFSDFLFVKDENLLVTKIDQNLMYNFKAPFSQFDFKIKKLLIGKFTSDKRQNFCVSCIGQGERLHCFERTSDNRTITEIFAIDLVFDDHTQLATGDFDGDGYDEIAHYNPQTPKLEIFKYQKADGTHPAGIRLLSLDTSDFSKRHDHYANTKIFVGNFINYDTDNLAKDDILLYDPGKGKIFLFHTRVESLANNNIKFSYALESGDHFVHANEELSIVNGEEDNLDTGALRSTLTGKFRFFKIAHPYRHAPDMLVGDCYWFIIFIYFL